MDNSKTYRLVCALTQEQLKRKAVTIIYTIICLCIGMRITGASYNHTHTHMFYFFKEIFLVEISSSIPTYLPLKTQNLHNRSFATVLAANLLYFMCLHCACVCVVPGC